MPAIAGRTNRLLEGLTFHALRALKKRAARLAVSRWSKLQLFVPCKLWSVTPARHQESALRMLVVRMCLKEELLKTSWTLVVFLGVELTLQ